MWSLCSSHISQIWNLWHCHGLLLYRNLYASFKASISSFIFISGCKYCGIRGCSCIWYAFLLPVFPVPLTLNGDIVSILFLILYRTICQSHISKRCSVKILFFDGFRRNDLNPYIIFFHRMDGCLTGLCCLSYQNISIFAVFCSCIFCSIQAVSRKGNLFIHLCPVICKAPGSTG